MTSSPWPPPTDPNPGYGPPGYGQAPEDNVWAVLAHLSFFVFTLLAPLVIYLVVKDDQRKPLARQHAAEALNFHLSLLIYSLVMLALFVLAIFIPSPALMWVVVAVVVIGYIAAIVLTIVAAVAAGGRRPYRYPLTIHFLR